jgi:hypothetical protein
MPKISSQPSPLQWLTLKNANDSWLIRAAHLPPLIDSVNGD